MSKKGLIISLIVGCLFLFIVIPGCTIIGNYNKLVTMNESVDGAWAQVENVLQRRYDLIPNLVETVKGFAKQERELLTEVTRLRSQWGAAKTPQGRLQASQGLEGALGRLLLVAERYPNLKSNQNFLRLQDELAGTENRIAVQRRRYNDTVRNYNIIVKRFPTNLVAGMFGYAKRDEYFKADQGAAEAPKVKF